MTIAFKQTGKHSTLDPQIIAKMYVRAEGPHDFDLQPNGSRRIWFNRLAFGITPVAIIACGFGAQIVIQDVFGEANKLPGFLVFLLELWLLWKWNRMSVLSELRGCVRDTRNPTKVSVELIGLARQLSGAEKVTLDEKPQASLRDVLQDIGHRFPNLMDKLIVPGSYGLHSPCKIMVNGRNVPVNLEEPLQDGERLVLMFPP